MTRFITMNTGKAGYCKSNAVHTFLLEFPAEVVAVQEVDIPPASRASFVRFWREHGFTSVLAGTDEIPAKAALMCTTPVQALQLHTSNPSRVAAAVLELAHDDRVQKIIACSVYGFNGDRSATAQLLDELLHEVISFGFPFILLGDWQDEACDPPVAHLLSSGAIHCLDDSFTRTLPKTGPGRCNRIDFGLCSRQIFAQEVEHASGVGDHLAVRYLITDWSTLHGLQRPSRSRVACSGELMAERFQEESFSQAFIDAFNTQSPDEMWTVLSTFAEAALCLDNTGTPRHLQWQPAVRPRDTHKAAKASEPLPLRRLRRLQRRLRHLLHVPGDLLLASKVLRDVHSLSSDFPDLNAITLLNLNNDVETIDYLVDSTAATVKLEAIAHWKAKLHDDPIAQAAWIKSRAAADLERMTQPTLSADAVFNATIHPSNVLEEQQAKWTRVWNPTSPAGSVEDVSQLLREVPRPETLDIPITWTVSALKSATRAMQGKAGGADDWRPEDLLLLPDAWWKRFAQLWAFCYQHATLPRVWKLCRVSLARKPSGSYRPISLCSVAWRAGSRHLCRSLRGWAKSWMGAHDLGGLPGCSPADAHGRLFTAIASGVDCFLQEDLTTFFDTITIEHAVQVLLHLRMPEPVAALFQEFYIESERILSFGGFVASSWTPIGRGLLQGCPMSALVAASVMHVWTSVVANQDTECLAFLDDRTCWPLTTDTGRSKEVMIAAATRGRRFDKAFGLASDKTKSAVVGSAVFDDLARNLEYPRTDALEALGLVHPLDPLLPRRLRKFSLEKVELRFKYIAGVTYNPHFLLRHVRSLVFSMIQWAAGFASPTEVELNRLRDRTFGVFRRNVVFETPKLLFHEVFDWWTHPRFAMDWSVILAIERFQCMRPGWMEHVPLGEAVLPWLRVLPTASALLSRCGWTCSPCGGQLQCRDEHGTIRVFRLGFESHRVLLEWLKDIYRKETLRRTGRVCRSYHRSDPHLAVGLDLPAPPRRGRVVAAGHKAVWKAAAARPFQLAALACGGTCWYYFSLRRGALQRIPDCLCGLAEPSRPHLLWCCPFTADLRARLELPVHRCEERLFAVLLPEEPPGPSTLDAPGLLLDLLNDLERTVSWRSTTFVATDGSSKDNVGAFALYLPGSDTVHTLGLDGEDQSSYRAELSAIDFLLSALCNLSERGFTGKIVILTDCEAAVTASSRGWCKSLPLLANRIYQYFLRATSYGMIIELSWLPAHGRQRLHWVPHPDVHPDVQRGWNYKADEAAKGCLLRRWQGSPRAAYRRQMLQAKQWEIAAITASAEAALRFQGQLC